MISTSALPRGCARFRNLRKQTSEPWMSVAKKILVMPFMHKCPFASGLCREQSACCQELGYAFGIRSVENNRSKRQYDDKLQFFRRSVNILLAKRFPLARE